MQRPPRRLVRGSAVLAEPTDLLVLGRVGEVERPYEVVDDAVSAGLIRVTSDAVVDCAHELLRAAIYSATPLRARRERQAQNPKSADRRHPGTTCRRAERRLGVVVLEGRAGSRRRRSN